MRDPKALFEVEKFPVFQNVTYRSVLEARNCPTGDIRLVVDPASGVVVNSRFDRNLASYEAGYENDQGCSPSFLRHLKDVAGVVTTHMRDTKVLEVGCGNGRFLELLSERGVEIEGFDPAYRGQNPLIKKGFLDSEIRRPGTSILLRHVLEHVQGPRSFLEKLSGVSEGGLVYIEVPCLDWILRNRSWFDVYYEHVNYFRLSDFHRLFSKVLSAGHLFQGQYIYAIARLDSLRSADDVLSRVDSDPSLLSENFKALIPNFSNPPKAIWGASSKGVIYSVYRERSQNPVQFVIDINPLKVDTYLPLTGLRVVSHEKIGHLLPEGETILVMNPNYLEEVREMTQHRYELEVAQ